MGSRILLADDSITIQKVVNLTFADEGIEVVAVSNGDVAERRLNEVKPDLVLADIFMPGKNGYELCEAIKQNPQFRNVPVVLLVGAFEPFDQNEAKRVQADAHLTKPFESRTLVETVRRLIGASSNTSTGPIAPMPLPGDHRDDDRDAGPELPPMGAVATTRLDLSAMNIEPNDGPATISAHGKTGELASPSTEALTDPLDLESVGIPQTDAVNAPTSDTSRTFETLEMSSPFGDFEPADMARQFGADDQDMVLDFDKSEPFETAPPSNAVKAETVNPPQDDASGGGQGWFSRDSVETRALHMPSTSEGWKSNGNGQSGWQNTGATSESAIVPSDGTIETACATMLAVDDPLGDVLLDDGASDHATPAEAEPAPIDFSTPNAYPSWKLSDVLPMPVLAGDEPPAHDTVAVEQMAVGDGSTQFALVEPAADPPPQEAIEFDAPNQVRDVPAIEATLTMNDQPSDSEVVSKPEEAKPVSFDASPANLHQNEEWTSPKAGVYSTAQLDSVRMPIETRDFIATSSENNDLRSDDNQEEPGFESARAWTDEEARFTPIDIEAFPVDEPEAAVVESEPQTAFSSPSATMEERPGNGSQPPAAHEAATGDSMMSASELSSSAMDEIVRRVVAEMSSSVVREVAWEVVPDCVERVISQLTRESLSKRL